MLSTLACPWSKRKRPSPPTPRPIPPRTPKPAPTKTVSGAARLAIVENSSSGPASLDVAPPVDTAQSLKEEAAEIKRGRGRPRKNPAGSAGAGDKRPAGENLPPRPSQWSPESARVLLTAEGLLFGGISGWDGFCYSAEQTQFLSPLLADMLQEILPYDATWVKISAFLAAYAGIKTYQFRAFRAARAKAKKEATSAVAADVKPTNAA